MKPALLPTIELGYGHGSIQFNYDSACFDILAPQVPPAQPLSDSEIGAALDAPIDSSTLEDLIARRHGRRHAHRSQSRAERFFENNPHRRRWLSLFRRL